MNRASVEDVEILETLTNLDLSGFFAQPDNVCVLGGGGAAFFGYHEPGIYEVHCHFTERGKAVRETSKKILDFMRNEHGAKQVYAPIPDKRRDVKAYVRWLGFKPSQPIILNGEPAELFLLEM